MMFSIDINALESEKQTVISFYKKQLEAYRYLKREIEKVQWSDANYDSLVSTLNIISRALSNMIQTITNGIDVYAISELIPLANQYVENERKFPKI